MNLRLLIFSTAFLVGISMSGQSNDSTTVADPNAPFSVNGVERPPIYPGCDENASNQDLYNCMGSSIMKHIAHNFVFPKEAREKGIQGKMYVTFIIEKDGSISNVNMAKGVHEILDTEAMRVISSLPDCQPALIDGEPVRMQYTVPINARLGSTEKNDSKKK